MHGRHGRGRWPGGGPGTGRASHMLEPALLCSLLEGPAHGYALVEKLGDFGLETVSLRRVYRAMQRMEEMAWVSSDWEADRTQGPPRRVYVLQPEGERVLAEWMTYLRESKGGIDRLLDAFERRRQR
jgi:PadR family transcriptional regulator, regulatory protein PadR